MMHATRPDDEPRRQPISFAWVVAAVAGACGGADEHSGNRDGGGDRITFAEHVAPVIYTSCTPCHRPGQPTPFSLLDYDDVYKRHEQIVEVTGDRLMPPWLPSHGDFVDDRRLTDEAIVMLRTWSDGGAPRGDTSQEPPCPTFPDEWQLGEPDLVVTGPTITVPAAGPDVFRNYVVSVPVDRQRFVEAVEIRPGSPAAHHAVLAVDETSQSRRRAALDPEPGFAGMDFGNARPPDGYFIGWTPGKHTRRSPPGMSWRLSKGSDLVLQLHLTPIGKTETLQPRIGLYFTETPPSVVSYPLCMFAPEIDLPPGAADVVVTDHFVVPVRVEVQSIYPHAHYLCRRMAAWATMPNGTRRDLFRIDRWDFDWQDDYRYRQPITLPAGTRIDFEYHYDNSADNPANPFDPPRHVRLGDRSTDEMGNLTLQVTTSNHEARRSLGEAGIRRDLQKRGQDAALLIQLASLLRETGRVDEALANVTRVLVDEPQNADALREQGACLAAAGRLPEAETAYARCIALDPNQNVARIQLANLLMRTGRTEEAITRYDEALRLSPDMAALHNNLATACLAANQIPRAEYHFRRTLELDATFFQAWFYLGQVLAATGRTDEARTKLMQAQTLRPDDARVTEALQQLGR